MLSVQCAHVRAKKFVWRTREKITIEGLHVNCAVGRVMYGVDKYQRADGMGKFGNFRYGIDGAHGVGGVAYRDELGFFGELAF